MAKNTGKVREFCQFRKVGTLDLSNLSCIYVCVDQNKAIPSQKWNIQYEFLAFNLKFGIIMNFYTRMIFLFK